MVAVLSIMVHSESAVEKVNTLLHDYRNEILGRMGLPVRDKNVSVISIVMDTDTGKVNALTGKLGSIDGVKAKALYSGT